MENYTAVALILYVSMYACVLWMKDCIELKRIVGHSTSWLVMVRAAIPTQTWEAGLLYCDNVAPANFSAGDTRGVKVVEVINRDLQ